MVFFPFNIDGAMATQSLSNYFSKDAVLSCFLDEWDGKNRQIAFMSPARESFLKDVQIYGYSDGRIALHINYQKFEDEKSLNCFRQYLMTQGFNADENSDFTDRFVFTMSPDNFCAMYRILNANGLLPNHSASEQFRLIALNGS